MDKHWCPSNDIAIGTEVWLDASDIKIPNVLKTMKKLSDNHVGPFKVLKKIGASAYKLELPEQWKIHPTFNESKLTPYVPPLAQHQKRPPPPPPKVVGGHKHHKVNEILNSCRRGRYSIRYLLDWKGYGPEDHTWAIPSDIKADDSIREFHKKYPDRPKPYVRKATRVRFTNIEERPRFNRVTFPADFFDPYAPRSIRTSHSYGTRTAYNGHQPIDTRQTHMHSRSMGAEARYIYRANLMPRITILPQQVMSTPLFLPDHNKALSSPDTPWKPPPKSLSPIPEPDNIVKTEDDQTDSAMICPCYPPPTSY